MRVNGNLPVIAAVGLLAVLAILVATGVVSPATTGAPIVIQPPFQPPNIVFPITGISALQQLSDENFAVAVPNFEETFGGLSADAQLPDLKEFYIKSLAGQSLKAAEERLYTAASDPEAYRDAAAGYLLAKYDLEQSFSPAEVDAALKEPNGRMLGELSRRSEFLRLSSELGVEREAYLLMLKAFTVEPIALLLQREYVKNVNKELTPRIDASTEIKRLGGEAARDLDAASTFIDAASRKKTLELAKAEVDHVKENVLAAKTVVATLKERVAVLKSLDPQVRVVEMEAAAIELQAKISAMESKIAGIEAATSLLQATALLEELRGFSVEAAGFTATLLQARDAYQLYIDDLSRAAVEKAKVLYPTQVPENNAFSPENELQKVRLAKEKNEKELQRVTAAMGALSSRVSPVRICIAQCAALSNPVSTCARNCVATVNKEPELVAFGDGCTGWKKTEDGNHVWRGCGCTSATSTCDSGGRGGESQCDPDTCTKIEVQGVS